MFSGLALGLAAFGVFTVMHYSVASRRNEIGVRMALGADRGDILRLIVAKGVRLATYGSLGGAAFAPSVPFLAAMLYGVGPVAR